MACAQLDAGQAVKVLHRDRAQQPSEGLSGERVSVTGRRRARDDAWKHNLTDAAPLDAPSSEGRFLLGAIGARHVERVAAKRVERHSLGNVDEIT